MSYDTVADQWLIASVPLPSDQSPAFHFVSQLLDLIDTGLKMATIDIRSAASQSPLHGVFVSYSVHMDFIKAV